jgi:CheY-like chemotaxis protein
MNTEQSVRPIEILLVEDNPADVRLTMETIKDYKVKNRLEVVGNGLDAMDFLRRKGKFADKTRPDLILLDLNLPGHHQGLRPSCELLYYETRWPAPIYQGREIN